MPLDDEYLKHLLELEYEHSQRVIDKFDEYRARFKDWMITAAAGIAAVAFSSHNSSIFWAGALMVIFFGLARNVLYRYSRRCDCAEPRAGEAPGLCSQIRSRARA